MVVDCDIVFDCNIRRDWDNRFVYAGAGGAVWDIGGPSCECHNVTNNCSLYGKRMDSAGCLLGSRFCGWRSDLGNFCAAGDVQIA